MELIEVYDENNNYMNYCLDRKDVHDKNLWHHHVSAWIMNGDGKVLLQQGALSKKKNPGKWAKTGGHVEAFETCDEAIRREIFEEIGLIVEDNEMEQIEIFKSQNSKENYFSYGYIVHTNWCENQFQLQKEEVNAVKYYSIEEMEEIRKLNNQDYLLTNWNDESFHEQIILLKNYRNKLK